MKNKKEKQPTPKQLEKALKSIKRRIKEIDRLCSDYKKYKASINTK